MPLDLEFTAITLDFVGKVLITSTVLMVHWKIEKERKIDKYVIKGFRLEKLLGILGLILISVAYFITTAL